MKLIDTYNRLIKPDATIGLTVEENDHLQSVIKRFNGSYTNSLVALKAEGISAEMLDETEPNTQARDLLTVIFDAASYAYNRD